MPCLLPAGRVTEHKIDAAEATNGFCKSGLCWMRHGGSRLHPLPSPGPWRAALQHPHLQLPTDGPPLADSANSGQPLANGPHRRCATGLCSSKRSFPPRLNTKCGWSQSAVCLPDFLQDLDASVLSHPLHCSLKKLTASLRNCISPLYIPDLLLRASLLFLHQDTPAPSFCKTEASTR